MHYRARRGPTTSCMTLLVLAACHAAGAGGGPAPEPPGPRLEVQNHSVFLIDVLAIPQAGSAAAARVKLGSLGPFLRGTFTVPPEAQRADRTVQVEVHALASDTRWTAPAVPVDTGIFACIDVRADFNGHLNQSTLTTPRTGPNATSTTVVGGPAPGCEAPAPLGAGARAPGPGTRASSR